MKQRALKLIALWVPAITVIELAWITINTTNDTTRNIWGATAVATAIFGAACQHITRQQKPTHNQT